ncbi:MAG TPA: DDE-type integrase/transposase/recombinase [Candidatus Nanoarchaeia archaeon]|nr:DDE-type integrase/transposase/recombinase [Candidatus Nanoarchaeia archaeon]
MQIIQEQLKTYSDKREIRAKAVLEKGQPQALDEFTYLVPSQFDSNKKYKVTHIDSYSCECKDFELRCRNKGIYCKHIKAIFLFERLKNAYEIEPQAKREIEVVIETPKNDICPYCSCENIFKRGLRKTQLGLKQLYCCKNCRKRFVLEPIKNIKGNAKLVCLAMDCYYKGLSYRDISDQFKQFYGLNISHVSIREWVLKFSKVMEKYSKTLTPKTSGTWNADETLVLTKRGKDKENPNKNFDYVWNVIDNNTKFLLASINSGRSRKIKDAQNVMTEAYQQTQEMPNQIITDRYAGYQEGIRKTFKNWGSKNKVKHISILGRRKQINNNAVESHHTHQKEFQKIRRGITETQAYADGFKVYHNFVRKNVKDKLTPAEKCGIGINEQNRWYPILVNSVKKATSLTGEQKMTKSP